MILPLMGRPYSDQDLERIVASYRRTVEPTPVQSVADLKSHPNDILLSYWIRSSPFSLSHLFTLLAEPDLFNELFPCPSPREIPKKERPVLQDTVTYAEPHALATFITQNNGVFAIAYSDSLNIDGQGLLVAGVEEIEYTFPSGRKVRYGLLRNEITANISIFDAGYSEFPVIMPAQEKARATPDQMMPFLRDTSLAMLSLLAYHQGEIVEDYLAFQEAITGLVLAHELTEVALLIEGRLPEDRLEREIMVELQAREMGVNEGLNPAYHRKYVELRAHTCPIKGKNIFQHVLERLC